MQRIEENQTMETISVAAGDGLVNGSSMPINNIMLLRIRSRGYGAGDFSNFMGVSVYFEVTNR